MFEVVTKTGFKLEYKKIDALKFEDSFLYLQGERQFNEEDSLSISNYAFDSIEIKDIKSITWREEFL